MAETLGEGVFDFFLRNKRAGVGRLPPPGHPVRAETLPAPAVVAGQRVIRRSRTLGPWRACRRPEDCSQPPGRLWTVGRAADAPRRLRTGGPPGWWLARKVLGRSVGPPKPDQVGIRSGSGPDQVRIRSGSGPARRVARPSAAPDHPVTRPWPPPGARMAESSYPCEIRPQLANTKITGGRRSVNGAIGLFVPRDVIRQRCANYTRKGVCAPTRN